MSKPSIHFFYEDVSVRVKNVIKLKNWIKGTVVSEKGTLKNLNYIFCSDGFLRDINIRYLNHDSLTDIITFNTSDSQQIEGEIYVSIDRVMDNAKKYNVEFTEELHRVMIHGILHLLGYGDKSPQEKLLIRKKENAYLSLREL